MSDADVLEYKQHIKDRLAAIAPVLANAAIGDFSGNIELPEQDEELADYFVGAQLMLETIREKIAELEATIAELRKANEIADREKSRVEAILDGMGDGFLMVDNNCDITYANVPAATLMGKKALNIGEDATEVMPIEDELFGEIVPRDQHPVLAAIRDSKQIVVTLNSGPHYYLHTDTNRFRAAFTITPIRQGAATTGAAIIFRDITEESNIDSAKSELISIASHQLRTPLATVKWYTDGLLSTRAPLEPAKQLSYLQQIYDSNQRMIELVNNLLNVSRLDLGTFALRPQTVQLGTIVEETLSDLALQIHNKNLVITQQTDKDLAVAKVDPDSIRVVMQNLLSNAVRYSLPNQEIIITLKNQATDILISVKDGGIGIPQQQQSHIFTKLFRADNARLAASEGSGLGLYISKAMVERSGGKIWFESSENQGTTFYVTIPRE